MLNNKQPVTPPKKVNMRDLWWMLYNLTLTVEKQNSRIAKVEAFQAGKHGDKIHWQTALLSLAREYKWAVTMLIAMMLMHVADVWQIDIESLKQFLPSNRGEE